MSRKRTIGLVVAGIAVGGVLALLVGGVLVGLEYGATVTRSNNWTTLSE